MMNTQYFQGLREEKEIKGENYPTTEVNHGQMKLALIEKAGVRGSSLIFRADHDIWWREEKYF